MIETLLNSGDVFALSGLGDVAEPLIVVGQASVEGLMNRVLNMFRMIAVLFAVMGLMFSAYQLYSNGDVKAACIGVFASALMGASAVIVVSLFDEAGGGDGIDYLLNF
ncbi:MAG: hypothetical protein ACPGN3_15970 [Opitutales bacterium]